MGRPPVSIRAMDQRKCRTGHGVAQARDFRAMHDGHQYLQRALPIDLGYDVLLCHACDFKEGPEGLRTRGNHRVGAREAAKDNAEAARELTLAVHEGVAANREAANDDRGLFALACQNIV